MTAQSDRVARELERHINAVKLEMGHRLVAKLKERTPVDTGYARSRWAIVELGPAIDVMNDAPYIMRLNDGWSQQAPAGFIEQCIDEVLAEMRVVLSRPIRILESSGSVFEYYPAGMS